MKDGHLHALPTALPPDFKLRIAVGRPIRHGLRGRCRKPRHIPAGFLVHEGRAITKKGMSMRSLWRILALQWLGGEGSEALTGDSIVLELMMSGEHARAMRAFDVQRARGVSRQAMMPPNAEHRLDPEDVIEEEPRNNPAG